jgi:hypothetical protein
MKRVMVQYTVNLDRAAENEELVRAVYDEPLRTRPDRLRYATFRLSDRVSFVHLAEHDEDGAESADAARLVQALPGGHRGALKRWISSADRISRDHGMSTDAKAQPASHWLGAAACRWATGFAHSTVWKVLKRAGISRTPRQAKEQANTYEGPCPGDQLHVDVSRYARFLRPGHRVRRSLPGAARAQGRNAGRLRMRVRPRRRPLTARLRRAAQRRESADRDRVRRAGARLHRRPRDLPSRLMTDNAFAYVHNRSLRELLARS